MSEINTEKSSDHEEKKNSNHIAGCGIFLVILAVVVFLISVSVYSYFDHKKAFINFSQESITPTELADTSDTSTVAAIEQKFTQFGELVKNNEHAFMELSKDEINLAVAHFSKLAEFKNTLFITAITDTNIEARSSFPINAGFDGKRHFNGKIFLKPVIAQGSIFPIVEKAESDTGAGVPGKVLHAIPILMFAGYRNDQSIQNVFHKLTKVELKNGNLHITSDPGSLETPLIDQDISEETTSGFQFFGLLCFIFITTIAFVIWYGKLKKKQSA